MTSFPALSDPLSGAGIPGAAAPGANVWRAVLALSVVLVLLATTGWTAVREDSSPGPYAAGLLAWEKGSIAGRPLPGPHWKPADHRGFFRSLSTRQQQQLADRYPLVVGTWAAPP